jgi:hypothetical protein
MIDLIAGSAIMRRIDLRKMEALPHAEIAEPECLNCYDCGWVCEAHRDQPWAGTSNAPHACDCGGAGSPCPVCEWDMATAGIADETKRSHARCADALNTKQARIDRALEQVTDNANATVTRMARILRGEQG